MYEDALLKFSAAQAIAGTGALVSTNVVDLHGVATAAPLIGQAVSRDVGPGHSLEILFTAKAAMSGGTSVAFEIITDDNESMSSPAVVDSHPAITAFAAGDQYTMRVPILGAVPMERYLAIRYQRSGTIAGLTLDAVIVVDVQTNS